MPITSGSLLAHLVGGLSCLSRTCREHRFMLLTGLALGCWGAERVVGPAELLSVSAAVLLARALLGLTLTLPRSGRARLSAATQCSLLAGSALVAVRMLVPGTPTASFLPTLDACLLGLVCLVAGYGRVALSGAGLGASRVTPGLSLLLLADMLTWWMPGGAGFAVNATFTAGFLMLAASPVPARPVRGGAARSWSVNTMASVLRGAASPATAPVVAASACALALVITAAAASPDPYLLGLGGVLVVLLGVTPLLGYPRATAVPGDLGSPGAADSRDQGLAPKTAPSPHQDLGRDLDEAVAARRLDVAYQPVVDVRTGRPVAAEALARWTHPHHGPVPPAEFVSLAERRGSVGALGTLVLDQAVAAAAEWHRAGYTLPVSVNISLPQLEDAGFPALVSETLARHGLPATALVIEVTESVLASDIAAARGTLHRLRALGVAIALDDFGTGYCSLAYLHLFPADVLKVDRELVAGAAGDPQRTVLLRAIATLAHDLDLQATAEGVESREEASLLDDLGFEHVQSFMYAPPMPAQDFHEWLSAHPATV